MLDHNKTLRKLIQETVREELKSGDMERIPAWEKEEIPGQMLDFFIFRWSRSKGGEAYGKEAWHCWICFGFAYI